jgi:predicted ATPase
MIHRAEHTIQRPGYVGGGIWMLKGMTDITIFMGKNGSGKSILLRAWRDQSPDDVHYIVPERTGNIEFQPNYMEQEFDGTRRRSFSTGNFVEEYRRRIAARVQTYFMKRGNFRGNGAVPAKPGDLEELIDLLVPDFRLTLQAGQPPYVLTRRTTDEVITQIQQLSSGEAQLVTLALDILTIAAIWEIEARVSRIMLVDEPDSHIHPDLQARFAEFLVEVADRFNVQFLVASHSTSLMSALGMFGGDRASVIYVDRTHSEYTAKRFDEATRQIAACLGGHVLMGPLFGAPLLLVEGDDDYRIWGQVPRQHQINLAVIPCGGDEIKKYQDTLEAMLTSLCDHPVVPVGYALLDGDKQLPQSNEHHPQTFIRFLKLSCHEAENLYLTDNVLEALGQTWDSAKQALKAQAANHGNKSEALSNCDTWDRRWQDVKTLINEISLILDPKHVHWTVRVGTVIGTSRPEGDIAEYLGDEVVKALWGAPVNVPEAVAEAATASA